MIETLITALLIGTAVYTAPAIPEKYLPPVIGEIILAHEVYAAEVPKPVSLTEEEVLELVRPYAEEYGVKVRSLYRTVLCEAHRNPDRTIDPAGQSNIVLSDGSREDSWGLAQIHLPDHPDVTKEQAQDADFALSFMAEKFSSGYAHLWTCFRILKAEGKI